MTAIRNLFNEVQFELVKIILLNVFLSTVILFLAADLVALVFSMPLWYVIVVSAIYFVVMLVHELRKISVKTVEKNNPELREMLRTAKDNVQDDSLMAQALFNEVITKMKRVSSGTFLDFRKLMTKLGIVFALAMVLISIAFFNVNIARFENPLDRPLSALAGIFGGKSGPVEGYQAEQATDDIFGDPRMAQLGDDQLTATVNPALDNPDFNNVDPASPTADPLQDLAAQDAGFNTGEGYTQEGIDQRDLQRSYEYAKATQD